MTAKKPKLGNVSVPKSKVSMTQTPPPAFIQEMLSNKGSSTDFPPFVPKPPNPINDFFNTSTNQIVSTPFEVQTGLSSDKPEIVSLIDFTPVYHDNGNLTKFGELLQSKQDSKLISAKSSINSLLSLSGYNKIEEKIKNNKKQIRNFFSTYTDDIKNLFFEIDALKRKMDFRYPLDQKILEDAGFGQGYSFGKPFSIEDILNETSLTIGKWTPTKTWIQSCLKIKDILREGMPLDPNETNFIADSEKYKDPFSIISTTPPNSRFSYNQKVSGQGKIPNLFGLVDNTNTLETSGYQDFLSLAVDLNKTLLSDLDFSIFTSPPFPAAAPLQNVIAKFSYLISKEYVFSQKMADASVANSKISQILTDFGYTAIVAGSNKQFWDNSIGLAGNDITDIQISPTGIGNSFISLSQSIEENNVQVLTFEDQYVSDNIGQKKGSTLTPGTFYYLESSLNSNANGFSTGRITTLIDKIDKEVNFSNFVFEEMLFDNSFLPYNTIKERILKTNSVNIDSSPSSPQSDDFLGAKFLSNPISLIRKIENFVLSDTGLLNREFGPPTVSDYVQSGKNFDPSGLFISSSIENSELLSLLFLWIRVQLEENTSGTSSVEVWNLIIEKVRESLGTDEQITFVNINVSNFVILSRIKEFLVKIKNEVSNTFFLETPSTSASLNIFSSVAGSDEFISNYSGISITGFLFTIFYLCCLMVHSANPDRILGIGNSNDNRIYYKRLYDPFNVDNSINITQLFQKKLGNNVPVKSLVYDKIVQESENFVFSYIKKSASKFNSFRMFLKTLRTRLINFRSQLDSGKFNSFLNKTREYLSNPEDVRRLLTREQLRLVQSLGHDLFERCSEDYSSPIKSVYPYFDSLKSNKTVDNLLPIEDVSVVSWNLFLKNRLKQSRFLESAGFNFKIASVGIPHQLVRRMQTNANELSGNSKRNKLIKINIYRIDTLRPTLIHKPLTFLFDLTSYPTRNLDNFDNAVDVLNGKQQINYIPLLTHNDDGEVSLTDYFSSEFAFLGPTDRQKLYDNHTLSLVMEEYFRFVSDLSISEMNFNEYNPLTTLSQNEFDSFMNNTLGQVPENLLNPSCKKFFLQNTLLFSSTKNFITKCLRPRKFDRIFHVAFDPDDFEINTDFNVNSLLGTSPENLNNFINNGTVELKNGVYKRKPTLKNQVTFDRFFTTLESYSVDTIISG